MDDEQEKDPERAVTNLPRSSREQRKDMNSCEQRKAVNSCEQRKAVSSC